MEYHKRNTVGRRHLPQGIWKNSVPGERPAEGQYSPRHCSGDRGRG